LLESSIGYTNRKYPTLIFRGSGEKEVAIGYLDSEGVIYKLRWDQGIPVGRVSEDHHLFRNTRFDEREVGKFSPTGKVTSSGLLEGGDIGWVEEDGTVVCAGLIFGEEEVGRVEGNNRIAGGAALLLIFLVDEVEETNRANR
jgi:hypothetical protein